MEAVAAAHVALGEAHQRETGLGVPADVLGGQQGLLGALDVSPAKSDPSQLAQRPPELAAQVGPELLARPERLDLCLVARSAQPENLRAMDPAATVEAPDGVRRAPPLHRRRPFLGHVVLSEPLQSAHELAVHDARGERIEITGDEGDPHVVEQRETSLDLSAQDEQPGLRDPSQRARRRITPRARLDCAPGPRSSAVQVARQHPLVRADRRKPRVRRRLVATLEQPLRSSQPPADRRHQGGVEEQVHRDADGGPCRPDLVSGLQRLPMSAFPGLDADSEVARGIGDLAEQA